MRHHDHEGGGGRGEDLESVDSTMERERALRRIIVVRVRCSAPVALTRSWDVV